MRSFAAILGHLEAILGPLAAILGPLGVILGFLGATLSCLEATLVPAGLFLAPLWTILAPLKAALRPLRLHLVSIWGPPSSGLARVVCWNSLCARAWGLWLQLNAGPRGKPVCGHTGRSCCVPLWSLLVWSIACGRSCAVGRVPSHIGLRDVCHRLCVLCRLPATAALWGIWRLPIIIRIIL